MRDFSSATLAALQSRGGIVARVLIWVEAKNRASGETETMGLWNGADHQTFTVGGEERGYFGAGNVSEAPPVSMAVGLDVRMYRLQLAPLTPEVVQLIRGYDARFAPVEMHRVLFDPVTRRPVDAPHRIFRGYIDEIDITEPEGGGDARCEVIMATSARALTRVLALKKSDEVQSRRQGDRFRRYADISGVVDVWWGEKRHASGGK